MFKELGEFIDDVGKATGQIIKRGVESLLNDENKDDDMEGLMGCLPEDLERELEKGEEVVVRDYTKNNK